MSRSEYKDHITLPGTMMSKSLANALAQENATPPVRVDTGNDVLVVTAGEQNHDFARVIAFSVSDSAIETSVVTGKDKMKKSQSLYEEKCSLAFGYFEFENLSLVDWRYTIEGEKIVVTMAFNRKLNIL